jgi:hypothetical protein
MGAPIAVERSRLHASAFRSSAGESSADAFALGACPAQKLRGRLVSESLTAPVLRSLPAGVRRALILEGVARLCLAQVAAHDGPCDLLRPATTRHGLCRRCVVEVVPTSTTPDRSDADADRLLGSPAARSELTGGDGMDRPQRSDAGAGGVGGFRRWRRSGASLPAARGNKSKRRLPLSPARRQWRGPRRSVCAFPSSL